LHVKITFIIVVIIGEYATDHEYVDINYIFTLKLTTNDITMHTIN